MWKKRNENKSAITTAIFYGNFHHLVQYCRLLLETSTTALCSTTGSFWKLPPPCAVLQVAFGNFHHRLVQYYGFLLETSTTALCSTTGSSWKLPPPCAALGPGALWALGRFDHETQSKSVKWNGGNLWNNYTSLIAFLVFSNWRQANMLVSQTKP